MVSKEILINLVKCLPAIIAGGYFVYKAFATNTKLNKVIGIVSAAALFGLIGAIINLIILANKPNNTTSSDEVFTNYLFCIPAVVFYLEALYFATYRRKTPRNYIGGVVLIFLLFFLLSGIYGLSRMVILG